MISVAQPSTFKWHFHFSSSFIDISIFRAHTCLFWVTTTHPGLPSPPITNWHTPHPPPGLVPCPSHSPITLGDPKVDSHMHTHTCTPDWGPIHPLPGRFLLTSGSQWLGSHYNTFLWGAHATHTACPPHSSHFFAGLCWHSVHPQLRSRYNTHWLGAILLALYACPTSTTPADFILALHSSTAGELVKTPSMLPFGDTPAFLGPTLTIPWPVDREASFWSNPCVRPLRPMRAQP